MDENVEIDKLEDEAERKGVEGGSDELVTRCESVAKGYTDGVVDQDDRDEVDEPAVIGMKQKVSQHFRLLFL